MRLLVNNVEQAQPQHEDGTQVVLYGRPEHDLTQRIEVRVHGFDPYFYARESEVREEETFLLGQSCIREIEYGDFESLSGESLAKVYPPYPQHTREAREYFEDTWAADVPFTNRFLIDKELYSIVEIPDDAVEEQAADVHHTELNPEEPVLSRSTPGGSGEETGLQNAEPRIVTLDIEVDDRYGFPEEGEERILSIVAHDNYTDELVGFIDLNGREIEEQLPNECPDELDALHVQDTERKMLIDFRVWWQEKNADLVTGWNVDDFDISYLIHRFREKEGLNERVFSCMGWAGFSNRGDPRLKGHTVYDLLDAYKANQYTELDSYKLDDIAKEELDAEKIQHGGSLFDLYEEDTEKFIRYNARDVQLCVDINREAEVIKFRDILRRQVGVTFEGSYNNKDFLDMMCRRKLKERGKVGPTRPAFGEEPDGDYEGAYVFDAYEGVAENVVAVDLASLYPYTMGMLNASPDTLVDPDEYDGDTIEAANGAHFRTDQDGLFRELVDDAINLKSAYKRARSEAETDELYEKFDRMYSVAKTITNSIYGVTGWERFFLYEEAVAEAVTLTGQEVIRATATYVEGKAGGGGYDVLYGDTDSVYISFPSEWERDDTLEEARRLCRKLNDEVYPRLAGSFGINPEDSLWEIEVEAHMERFFQAGKKKKYAYLATWKDGRNIPDPKPTIVGFSSVRSDSAQLTEETQERVIRAILADRIDDVHDIVFDAATEIKARPSGEEWERIGIPSGMNQKIDPARHEQDGYYSFHPDGYPQGAHPRGVWNANHILDVDLGTSDKPKRVYLQPRAFDEVGRQIDVIAFTDHTQLRPIEDDVTVDVERMTDTLLVNPLQRILRAVDVDTKAAVRGQTQTGLGAFS